ncbi:hypothetical protein S83_003461, partial [Arachis hypogaea]
SFYRGTSALMANISKHIILYKTNHTYITFIKSKELISVLASGRYSYSIPLCNLLQVGEYGRRKASFFCYYFKFNTILFPANATRRIVAAKLFMK